MTRITKRNNCKNIKGKTKRRNYKKGISGGNKSKRRKYNKKGGKKKNQITKRNRKQQILIEIKYSLKYLKEKINESAKYIINKMLELFNDMKKLNKRGKEYKEKEIHMNVLTYELLYTYKIYKLVYGVKVLEGGVCSNNCPSHNNTPPPNDRPDVTQALSTLTYNPGNPNKSDNLVKLTPIQFKHYQELLKHYEKNPGQNSPSSWPSLLNILNFGSPLHYMVLLAVIVLGVSLISWSPGMQFAQHLLKNAHSGLSHGYNQVGAWMGNRDSQAIVDATRKTQVFDAQTGQLAAQEKYEDTWSESKHAKLVRMGREVTDMISFEEGLMDLWKCKGSYYCLYKELYLDHAITQSEGGQQILKNTRDHIISIHQSSGSGEYMISCLEADAEASAVARGRAQGYLPFLSGEAGNKYQQQLTQGVTNATFDLVEGRHGSLTHYRPRYLISDGKTIEISHWVKDSNDGQIYAVSKNGVRYPENDVNKGLQAYTNPSGTNQTLTPFEQQVRKAKDSYKNWTNAHPL